VFALTNTRGKPTAEPCNLDPGLSVFGCTVIRLPVTVLAGVGAAAVAAPIPTAAVAASAVVAIAIVVLPRIWSLLRLCARRGRVSHRARGKTTISACSNLPSAIQTHHATCD